MKTLATWPLLATLPLAIAAQADDAGNNRVIENIIVTAERTSENLQNSPVSITAFSAQTIEKFQIDNAKDLSQVAPNVIIKPVSGGSAGISPYVRGGGVSDGANITSEAEVGIYIDDVYQPRSAASFIESLDMERIEVLRGPQGTLYGRNSSSGAIKFISKTPGEEFNFKNELGTGRWNEIYDKLSISGPLSDDGNLRGGFSGMLRDRDGGRQYNASLGKDVGEETFKGFQGDLYYVGDSYTARLKAFYTNYESDGLYASALNPFALDNSYNEIPFTSGSIDTVLSPFESSTEDKQYGANLNLSKDINENLTLVSITAWNTLQDDWATGFSGGVANSIFSIPVDGYAEIFERVSVSDQDSVSQELQLSGQTESGFINYVGGIYYFHESGTQNVTSAIFFGPSYTDFDVSTDSYAAFGQFSLNFTDSLSLTLGGRYTEDQKSLVADVSGGAVDRRDSFSKFTPKIAVDYQATDDILLFASYTEGFKAGGYNSLAGSAAALNVPFDMQELSAYEIGTKSEWLNNSLRINLAAFFNDYTNLQQAAVTSTGDFITENYDAEHYGLEAEVSVQLTNDLFIWANGVLQSSEYTGSSGASSASLVGNNMTNVFDWQYAIGFDYNQEIGEGTLNIGANMNSRDDSFATSDNAPIAHVEAQVLVDAYVSYSIDKWKVSLAGKNLTNEKYWFTGFGFSLVQPRFMADPMTWRLAVSYEL